MIFRSVDGAVLISVPSSAKAAETCQKIGEQPLNFLDRFTTVIVIYEEFGVMMITIGL